MSFAILTDTSANLPTPLLQKHGVTVAPFSYSYDGAEHTCLDTESFDGAAYYGAMRKCTVVTTSLVNPDRFISAARPLLAAGEDVLFVGMSSGISGSFGSAKLAAGDLREEFPGRDIQLIDTLGASLGEGILVLRAIEMRESGASLSETAAALRDMRWRMYQIFTVDDIMYLRRTGRLSNAKAIVASVLHIKPVLHMDDAGHLINMFKVRGRKASLNAMADKYGELALDKAGGTVFISHGDCRADADTLAAILKERYGASVKEIVVVGPVIGAHSGPGTLALFFLGEHR